MDAKRTYTVGELARAAGVTTRTVRYYVAQGLLPPPDKGGRAATYGDEHLHRLELVKLLKQEYLPLAEIKTLLDGLNGDAVRDLLQERRRPPSESALGTAQQVANAVLRPDDRSPSLLRQAAAKRVRPVSSLSPTPQVQHRLAALGPAPRQRATRPPEGTTNWQRHTLHPDIEVHVRQPPSDPRLGARLDQLIAEIRRLVDL